MNLNVYDQILKFASEKSMRERTVSYLAQQLADIVEPGEAVLICFHVREEGDLSDLMELAVERCGGRAVVWGEDHRWKTLLRLAFTSRASTVIGTPRIVLGLSKLKKAVATPLYIRNVITAGYPCTDWMTEGIMRGFDCRIYSCMSLFTTGVVAGFSCAQGSVHLRDSEYRVEIGNAWSDPLPFGTVGRWVISPTADPSLSCCPGEYGRLDLTPCPCGRPGVRMVERRHWDAGDKELAALAENLLSWTSVLDFILLRSPHGLELELVTFPGEKLPELPACARQVVRPWNPEEDEPFIDIPVRKTSLKYLDYH